MSQCKYIIDCNDLFWREKDAANNLAPFPVVCDDHADGVIFDFATTALLTRFLLSGRTGLEDDAYEAALEGDEETVRIPYYGTRFIKVGKTIWYPDPTGKPRPLVIRHVRYKQKIRGIITRDRKDPNEFYVRQKKIIRGVLSWGSFGYSHDGRAIGGHPETYRRRHVPSMRVTSKTSPETIRKWNRTYSDRYPNEDGRPFGCIVSGSESRDGDEKETYVVPGQMEEIKWENVRGDHGEMDGDQVQGFTPLAVIGFKDGLEALMRAKIDGRILAELRQKPYDVRRALQQMHSHNPPIWDNIQKNRVRFDFDLALKLALGIIDRPKSSGGHLSTILNEHMEALARRREFPFSTSLNSAADDELAGPAAGAQSLIKNLHDSSYTSLAPGEAIKVRRLRPASSATQTTLATPDAALPHTESQPDFAFTFVEAVPRTTSTLLPQTANQQNIKNKRKAEAMVQHSPFKGALKHGKQASEDARPSKRAKRGGEVPQPEAVPMQLKELAGSRNSTATSRRANNAEKVKNKSKIEGDKPSTTGAIREPLSGLGLQGSTSRRATKATDLDIFN